MFFTLWFCRSLSLFERRWRLTALSGGSLRFDFPHPDGSVTELEVDLLSASENVSGKGCAAAPECSVVRRAELGHVAPPSPAKAKKAAGGAKEKVTTFAEELSHALIRQAPQNTTHPPLPQRVLRC